MDFLYENFEEYEGRPTPSPGCDYNSLLNESCEEDQEKLTKYSLIETEKQDSSEVHRLRSENLFLKAQLEIAKKEKELHIQASAQDKIRLERNLNHLKSSFESELSKSRQEITLLLSQNKDLQKKFQNLQSHKSSKIQFYKMQLEKLENHYSILINDKDRTITMLKTELTGKKPKKTAPKKIASQKSSLWSSKYPSPKVTSSSFFPKSQLDDISHLIVKLEKEQAELKSSAYEDLENTQGSFNYLSLKEMGERNKERFNELQTQHKRHIKNRLSSEF